MLLTFWLQNVLRATTACTFYVVFWLRNVLRTTTVCTFSTSEPPKVARTCGVLYILTWKYASRHNGVHFFDISTSKSRPTLRGVLHILTWKCASRHNGVHFFDIWTSKSGPDLVCPVHFDLEMCFAPQRRALFRHLNFQKWSGAEVFCTFWLGNVLRATTASNFSSLIWPAGSAPAALASLLFDPPEPQITGKTQCFATFLPFHASASSFFLLFLYLSLLLFFLLIFLFSLPLPCSAFHLSILSEIWLLNFLRLERNLHAQCASQACACVLCAKLLQCCCPRTWPARVPGAMQRHASTFLTHHIAPFTLHIWALFIWFMSSHMSATFFLAIIFMSSERSSNFLMRWTYFQLISALLHVSKVERNSCRFFYMPKGVDHKIFTILRLLMPSVDALHQIATASVNMV